MENRQLWDDKKAIVQYESGRKQEIMQGKARKFRRVRRSKVGVYLNNWCPWLDTIMIHTYIQT